MKKSFTLKAFAFGAAATLALSASATPHSLLVNRANVASMAEFGASAQAPTKVTEKMDIQKMTMKLTPATQQASSKAPAQKAEANYGDWTEGGEGVFTYALFGDYESTPSYEIRQDNANEGDFQLKTNYGKGVFSTSGSEAIITVTANEDGTYTALLPEDGVYLFEGTVTDNLKASVYVYDFYHLYLHLQSKGYTFSDGSSITDEDLEAAKSYCTYDPETGTASFLVRATASFDNTDQYQGSYLWEFYWGTVSSAMESYRRLGDEFKYYGLDLDSNTAYFSHAQGATTGTYNMPVKINDNYMAAFRIVTGKKSDNAATTAIQTLVNDLGDESKTDIGYLYEDGTVAIPVSSYRKGTYTLIYAFTDGVANESGQVSFYGGYDNTLRATQEDVDYYDAGMKSFTDASMYDALPVVFGEDTYEDLQNTFYDDLGVELPDTYTVTVPCQASSKVEGQYRLVHPFSTYYDNYLSTQLNYEPTVDYLVYNVADPNKAYFEPCATGIYFYTSSGSYIMMVYGSTNKMNTSNTASADAWGTYADGVVTFDEVVIPEGATEETECTSALSWSQATYDTSTGAVTYKDWSSIVWDPQICNIGGESSGVKTVNADATSDLNAPVEYFNLQGIRIATPEAGQLLIKRQGSKATKVVIR
jgi:hypothetical protein